MCCSRNLKTEHHALVSRFNKQIKIKKKQNDWKFEFISHERSKNLQEDSIL